jgi:hypothetical protein
VLGKAERQAINAIKEIMLNFASMSGLKANFEKCILVPLGFDNDIPVYFTESGFTVDSKVKILGCTIYSDPTLLYQNFDEVIASIINLSNFWARFNLSLPGRVAIAKTLMLSKLSYLGSFLNPSADQIQSINNLIYTFIKGKLSIAMHRVNFPISSGSLGMLDINEFLTGHKLSWIKRAINSTDLWAGVLKNAGLTDPDKFRMREITNLTFPILQNISAASHTFRDNFLESPKNLMNSNIFLNPLVGKYTDAGSIFDGYVGPNPDVLYNLTYADITAGYRLLPRDSINTLFGTEISRDIYDKIKMNCSTFLHCYKRGIKKFESTTEQGGGDSTGTGTGTHTGGRTGSGSAWGGSSHPPAFQNYYGGSD